ncbi:MAG TPA: nucleoside transporter C-terminal domain-containing protein [Polyangiaceae bacterium]|nr:nucleoside transporter C-terminal domain-containing protein [Polyangiaceae bacterium]
MAKRSESCSNPACMVERLTSALGALILLGLALALCPRERRRAVSGRSVGGGLLVLLVVAVLVLKTPLTRLFHLANAAVDALLGYTRQGARFVFGGLVTESDTFGFIFAFQVLPTILFVSALTSVLYHLRVLPWIIARSGRWLSRTLRVSGAESFSTVADVFVGQTEAPLIIRPYLARMTLSELTACMVAGFATTAGGVLAAYVVMLQNQVPGIAGHLIACSVMSAPASLVIAKLIFPETEVAETSGTDVAPLPRTSANVLDAISSGTSDGVKLAVNVAAMLIVFLALTALVNAALGAFGELLGAQLSLERLFGWLFAPLAWLLGVPSGDVLKVAGLLGQKTVFNEFVAYSQLAEQLGRDPEWLTPRGRLIASYALCGFANFGSIGIQIGGYASLAPERRADLSRLALRAMFGGLLATCLVACVAGVLL